MTGLLRIWGLLLAGVLVAGCGVKAPPRPPERKPPAAVRDLSGGIADGAVILRWGIPPAGKTAGEAAGFAVYRSKTPLSEAECRDCPLTFTQVAQATVTPSDREAGGMTFSEPLEKGFRYRYKLRGFDVFGAAGGDSNTFSTDY